MKDKLLQLAKEKEFESNIIGKSVEAKYSDKDFYYLWMCELQRWLRDKHKFHIEIEFTDTTTQYYYEYFIIDSNNRDYCDEDFTDSAKRIHNCKLQFNTYKQAFEVGLFEALQLIK